MKMRTFIHAKPPNMSVNTAHHARYISERERDRARGAAEPPDLHPRPRRPQTHGGRPLSRWRQTGPTKTRDLLHVIIAFNSHDARELENLGTERAAALKVKSLKSEDSENEAGEQQSSKIEDSKSRPAATRPEPTPRHKQQQLPEWTQTTIFIF